jgi:DNA polymerase I-like protein with 3'-5' exonuclease and polymerase domains
MDRPGLISVRLSDKEEIELDMTDSGSLPTDGASLIQMGEVGVLIDKYKELLKVDTFIDATLAFSSEDGRVHPEFKAPGTLTGRLAGGGDLKGHKLNIQQLPKVRGYLETWVSDPGKIIIQADFSALENVVLAELSRDKALFDLYGPGRPNQDIYLYTGAGIAAIQKNILKSGYDPQNPTDEAIAKAKKEAKKERGISKVLVLSSGYGAGPHKIWKTLKAQKVDVSLQEVKQMHQDYWNLYKGIKDFEADVEREWYQNKGWVLNGLGRPIGIFHQKKKDLVNRVIQSTGHDCLMIVIVFLKEELDKEGIEWMPWIIDLHDELMFQVNLKDKEKAMACVDRAVKRLNLFLGGEIPLKMEPGAFTNLADIKVES